MNPHKIGITLHSSGFDHFPVHPLAWNRLWKTELVCRPLKKSTDRKSYRSIKHQFTQDFPRVRPEWGRSDHQNGARQRACRRLWAHGHRYETCGQLCFAFNFSFWLLSGWYFLNVFYNSDMLTWSFNFDLLASAWINRWTGLFSKEGGVGQHWYEWFALFLLLSIIWTSALDNIVCLYFVVLSDHKKLWHMPYGTGFQNTRLKANLPKKERSPSFQYSYCPYILSNLNYC